MPGWHLSMFPVPPQTNPLSALLWLNGRPVGRVAVGGYGGSPALAMDGTEAEGAESAARNACHDARDDRGSAEYRMDVAATLAARCLASFKPSS